MSDDNFPERIAHLAKTHGSASALARLINVSPGAVLKWLEGTEPTRDKVAALALATGVSVEWLVLGIGDVLKSMPDGGSVTGACDAALEPEPITDVLRKRCLKSEARCVELERDVREAGEDRQYLLEKLSALQKENARLHSLVTSDRTIAKMAPSVRRGPLLEAWPLVAVIGAFHPQPLKLTEIVAELERRRIVRTELEVEADLALLEDEGMIRRIDGEGYIRGGAITEVWTRDSSNVRQHAVSAVNSLLDEILPAVEKPGGEGFLWTSGLTVAVGAGAAIARQVVDLVRGSCKNVMDDSGGEQIRVVLGVGVTDKP